MSPSDAHEVAAVGPGRGRGIRVLLVDDHELVRIGLRELLGSHSDLQLCGEAANLAEARLAINELRPDVVLLDLTLGEESGLTLLRGLDDFEHPPRVLVLSMFDESLYSDDALSLGARGYVMKDTPADDLVRAIRTVAAGGIYLSDQLSQRIMRRVASGREQTNSAQEALTAREQEVIALLGEALTTREIAARMGTAVKTVDSHKRNICEKLGLGSAAALLRYAVVNAREPSRD